MKKIYRNSLLLTGQLLSAGCSAREAANEVTLRETCCTLWCCGMPEHAPLHTDSELTVLPELAVPASGKGSWLKSYCELLWCCAPLPKYEVGTAARQSTQALELNGLSWLPVSGGRKRAQVVLDITVMPTDMLITARMVPAASQQLAASEAPGLPQLVQHSPLADQYIGIATETTAETGPDAVKNLDVQKVFIPDGYSSPGAPGEKECQHSQVPLTANNTPVAGPHKSGAGVLSLENQHNNGSWPAHSPHHPFAQVARCLDQLNNQKKKGKATLCAAALPRVPFEQQNRAGRLRALSQWHKGKLLSSPITPTPSLVQDSSKEGVGARVPLLDSPPGAITGEARLLGSGKKNKGKASSRDREDGGELVMLGYEASEEEMSKDERSGLLKSPVDFVRKAFK